MKSPRIGVLRGGPSSEYNVSLASGGEVLTSFREQKQNPLDILVSKDGEWYHNGVKILPGDLKNSVDVLITTLRGTYGEDGKVQQILESLRIPYTGSGISVSALALQKVLAKEFARKLGLKTPRHIALAQYDYNSETAHELFRKIFFPVVIKPLRGGSSIGATFANTFEELQSGIQEAFLYEPVIIIEEYITGDEIITGIIENFRREKLYHLVPAYVPRGNLIYTKENKQGNLKLSLPAPLNLKMKELIKEDSKKVFSTLGLKHYATFDFVTTPRGLYFLEMNTTPPFIPGGALTESLVSVGSGREEFFNHLVDLALKR